MYVYIFQWLLYTLNYLRGKFSQFCGFLLIANVLPLKIFLEYRCHPLTTQSTVPPGLKFSTTKVFLAYILSFSDEPQKFSPSNDLTYTVYSILASVVDKLLGHILTNTKNLCLSGHIRSCPDNCIVSNTAY